MSIYHEDIKAFRPSRNVQRCEQHQLHLHSTTASEKEDQTKLNSADKLSWESKACGSGNVYVLYITIDQRGARVTSYAIKRSHGYIILLARSISASVYIKGAQYWPLSRL